MPTAYTVTPEPVTNSDGGWGVVSVEAGRREEGGGGGRREEQGRGREHLIRAALAICRPLTQPLLTAIWSLEEDSG